MNTITDQIANNLARVHDVISSASSRSGRSADDVQLVCVTKYAREEWIDALLECGQTALGENRPQQLAQRADTYPDHVRWHLVGQLQRNKVRRTLGSTHLIHSVDNLRLLNRIDSIATEEGRQPSILLQVNLSEDGDRNGFTDATLRTCWDRVCELKHTQVLGLMTMAPAADGPESSRPTFESLRNLADELGAIRVRKGGEPLSELSMGMSNDYEVAIEAGATIVRLGRTLFQGLEN